jgi:hypothetical protein
MKHSRHDVKLETFCSLVRGLVANEEWRCVKISFSNIDGMVILSLVSDAL